MALNDPLPNTHVVVEPKAKKEVQDQKGERKGCPHGRAGNGNPNHGG